MLIEKQEAKLISHILLRVLNKKNCSKHFLSQNPEKPFNKYTFEFICIDESCDLFFQALQRQQSLASDVNSDATPEGTLLRQASLMSELGLSGSLDLGNLSLDLKAKIPYKTKDGRRMTGRKVLNIKILNKVFGSLMKLHCAKFFKVTQLCCAFLMCFVFQCEASSQQEICSRL